MFLDYLTLLFCVLLSLVIWRFGRGSKLPPGPPARLIGNAHHIPQTEPWLAYKKFADQYGPIICLWMFNAKTILLNDYRTANSLLDQRSAIYSSRPEFWMAGYLAGRRHGVFLTKTMSPRFKIYRTLLHKTLNQRAIQAYEALQITECRALLKALLNTPDKFISHLRRNAVAVIMNVAYGYQVGSEEDEFVHLLEKSFELSGSLNVPGKFWVEFFPLLRHVPEWFPGAGFKRLAKSIAGQMDQTNYIPFNWAKSQIATGSYQESFVSDHIKDDKFGSTEEEREDILSWCSGSLYIGGGDTTVSILTTFFFLMALHPSIQKCAREEIDRVLGSNVVAHEDRPSLPYVNAMIKEIMRWGPVAPLAIPHQVIEDDYFDGYYIPKGARVMANVWAMAHDENVYPSPSVFDPTRFLGENQQMDPNKFVFGFGRRVCPGLHLAEASIFLNVTNILANFIISKKIGIDGKEIEPEAHWSTGITAHLKPFPCEITPRSPNTLRSMLSEGDNVA
ncbi:cytochrome P450 [Macrolepiota fuliginosa MF-IS2]|uniref:Cytochrome P450 n=1 Tax=Macrolepiota fuliginosa MF-IS2 TaxID=1400762 RepID=A0A9P6C581_9AGAR|nr:cytochrome P450 [Macrolepiota fuliginosa MF-IS2]